MAEAVFVSIKLRTKDINAITATKLSKYVYNLCAGLTAEWPKSVQKQTSIVELVQALQGEVDIGPTPITLKDLAEHPNQYLSILYRCLQKYEQQNIYQTVQVEAKTINESASFF